mgnify:CR=1 FL=1
MPQPVTPLFLERGSYRRRRMMDAVRLLVVLGAGLWMIPVIWPTDDMATDHAVPMSRALLYVFGVWFALISGSFLLTAQVRRMPPQADDSGRS